MKASIWVERYKPTRIADIIFQDERQRKMFTGFIESGDIPNLFLAGAQGTGKTSVSRVLVKELKVERGDVLTINCSDEKIDALRNKVTAFATTQPIGNFKVVRLEEIDYLSLDAQALLRGLIEQTQATCRFIATCNYANKVIPPVKSRFQEFYFRAPDKEKIVIRVADILEAEKVTFEVDDVYRYIDVGYPDIRKIIQLLQGNVQGGRLLNPAQVAADTVDWKFGLLDAISSGDLKKARKLVCESATREEHEDVYRFLYDNIDKLKVKDKDAAILVIAEYLYKHSIVADTEINLAALWIALSRC